MRAIEFKATREGLGLSIKELSKLSGLAESSIRKFEKGQFAIPPGLGEVFERVRAKVYSPKKRWATLTVEELADAKKGWVVRSKGWSAYTTQEAAEEATEFFPELWAIEVTVRKQLSKTSMRELWEELQVAGKVKVG